MPVSAFACSLKPFFNASFFGPDFAIRTFGLLGDTDRSLVFLLKRTIGMLLTTVGWTLYPFYSFIAIELLLAKLIMYLRASSAGRSKGLTSWLKKVHRYPPVAFGVDGISTEI